MIWKTQARVGRGSLRVNGARGTSSHARQVGNKVCRLHPDRLHRARFFFIPPCQVAGYMRKKKPCSVNPAQSSRTTGSCMYAFCSSGHPRTCQRGGKGPFVEWCATDYEMHSQSVGEENKLKRCHLLLLPLLSSASLLLVSTPSLSTPPHPLFSLPQPSSYPVPILCSYRCHLSASTHLHTASPFCFSLLLLCSTLLPLSLLSCPRLFEHARSFLPTHRNSSLAPVS